MSPLPKRNIGDPQNEGNAGRSEQSSSRGLPRDFPTSDDAPRRSAPPQAAQAPERSAGTPDDSFSSIGFDEQGVYDSADEKAEDAYAESMEQERAAAAGAQQRRQRPQQRPPQKPAQRPAQRPPQKPQQRPAQPAAQRPPQEAPEDAQKSTQPRPAQPAQEAQQAERRRKPAPQQTAVLEEDPTETSSVEFDGEDDIPPAQPKALYVDEKKGKLKKFGRDPKTTKKGEKSGSRKAAVAEFDERKNLRQKATLIQWGIVGLLAVMTGCGVKNAVLPPPSLSEDEVAEIVAWETGETGFPMARGEGFALDFMRAYMTRNNDPIAEAALNYYHTGQPPGSEDGGGGASSTDVMEISGDYQQRIAFGPTIYEAEGVSPNSAMFTVGVAISSSANPEGIPLRDREGNENIQWRFFNVNVHYDEVTNSMSIVEDSPTLIPPQNISESSEVPEREMPGTGTPDGDLTEATQSTVEGFIQAYADSSADDPSPLSQYTNENFEEGDIANLLEGFNGEFELNGTPSEAIEHETMMMDPDDPDYANAVVTVGWRDVVEAESEGEVTEAYAAYTATYSMRLLNEGDEENPRWVVTRFAPFLYAPDYDEAEAPAE